MMTNKTNNEFWKAAQNEWEDEDTKVEDLPLMNSPEWKDLYKQSRTSSPVVTLNNNAQWVK